MCHFGPTFKWQFLCKMSLKLGKIWVCDILAQECDQKVKVTVPIRYKSSSIVNITGKYKVCMSILKNNVTFVEVCSFTQKTSGLVLEQRLCARTVHNYKLSSLVRRYVDKGWVEGSS